MQATTTIPIVMAFDNDPVASGFVASLARPGGNVTGLSALTPQIIGKLVELLKETIPQLSRVAVLGTSTEPASLQSFREAEVVVKALGIQLRYFDVEHSSNIASIFRDVTKERVDAVLVLSSPVLNSKRSEIAKLAIQSRLPSAFGRPEYVEAGGLMTYGPSLPEMFWRAATYVDKILKGAKPSDLPVEQPTKFELVINLKTAKQIGLTIPPNVLARADRVIR